MLMWYIIFVLLILFTGGGLLYLGTRAAKFVPAGSTPKRRLLIGLSAVILIFAVIAWLINLMNAVVCLLHFVFLWLICDFIFTLVRRFRKRPFKRYYAGYAATALSLAALAAGWYLNHRVWVTAYTIESEKAISDLRIVLFADSHIGTTFDGEGFAKHVRAMQEQNPDLVVIAGDFVDDGTGREEMVAAARALGTLKTPHGVYFAFGNHDKGYYGPAYRGFSSGELIDELKKNNVKILEDESETVAGGFCLVGRQDRSETERGGRRLTMQELTKDLDPDKFSVVLDHQPNDYQNQTTAEVDLVLSGHTHGGQLFPLNKVGEWIGANDKTYGLEKRNKTNFIVTSGPSDWAIKFKTGTKSEFVVIDVKRKAATEKKGK